MAVHWLEKDELMPTATAQIQATDILLDIGCGIMPQRFISPVVHVCVEPFAQYVGKLQEKIKNEVDRSYVILNMTWAEALKVLPSKSVDTVIMIDVIEHIDKAEAKKLLKETEQVARHQIVIFTPLGFLPQSHPDGKDAWGLDGGQWQEHKSGWQPEDFDGNWDVYATKEFHLADNVNQLHDTPFGALWAIKTIKDHDAANRISIRTQMNNFGSLGLALHSPHLRQFYLRLMRLSIVSNKFLSPLMHPKELAYQGLTKLGLLNFVKRIIKRK